MRLRLMLRKVKPLLLTWRFLRNALYKSHGYVFKIEGINSKFYLPYIMTDDIMKEILYKKNYFERKSLDYIFKEWKNGEIGNSLTKGASLDIGANIGNHTLYYLNECDAKFVHCFEPMEDTFNILKKNIEINNLSSRTQLHNVGVGSRTGSASIGKHIDGNTGYTQLKPAEEGGVKIISIDDLNILEKVSFVKIDVEGFELEVLKGMQLLLKREKPFVMVELWNDNYEESCELLFKLGYKSEVLDKYPTATDCLFYAE